MKRILVVAPHPDDELIGVGGTILKNIANGNEVYVVVVTKGMPPLFEEKFVETTRNEARACHKDMGIIHTYYLDYPSTLLDTIPKHKLNGDICEIMKKIVPDEVYIPYAGDMHFDHGIVNEAVMVAVRPKYLFAPSKVYVYETLSETGWNLPDINGGFSPNVFVDISDCFDKKIQMLSYYRSQLEEFPAARSIEAVTALAKYRGALINVNAAEAFMIVREIIK